MPKNKSKTPKTAKKAETILNRITEQKKELLIHFRKNPVLQSVCHRVGISRSTVYRWMENDPTFAEFVKEAQSEGNEFVADMAKGQVIKHIGEGNLTACFFWLKTRKKEEFAERVIHEHKLAEEELSPEEQKILAKSLIYSAAPILHHKLSSKEIDELVQIEMDEIDELERKDKEHKEEMEKSFEENSEE